MTRLTVISWRGLDDSPETFATEIVGFNAVFPVSISCWVSSYSQEVLTQVFPHELFTAQLLLCKSVYEVLKGYVDEIDRHSPELCGGG
jgi:hypothetical protein